LPAAFAPPTSFRLGFSFGDFRIASINISSNAQKEKSSRVLESITEGLYIARSRTLRRAFDVLAGRLPTQPSATEHI
jgi:hypothetical protein